MAAKRYVNYMSAAMNHARAQKAQSVESVVAAALPDQPFAPTWCSGWLIQREIRNASAKQIAQAIEIYRSHFGLQN